MLTSLTKPELQIMEALWTRGACSIREIHEALPAKGRPAFTMVQTVVSRLEKKGAFRRVKRISNRTTSAGTASGSRSPRWPPRGDSTLLTERHLKRNLRCLKAA